jgi:hypothetical protein
MLLFCPFGYAKVGQPESLIAGQLMLITGQIMLLVGFGIWKVYPVTY